MLLSISRIAGSCEQLFFTAMRIWTRAATKRRFFF